MGFREQFLDQLVTVIIANGHGFIISKREYSITKKNLIAK
jgi:hypothetical protein